MHQHNRFKFLVLFLQWAQPNPTDQKPKNLDPTRPNRRTTLDMTASSCGSVQIVLMAGLTLVDTDAAGSALLLLLQAALNSRNVGVESSQAGAKRRVLIGRNAVQ